MKRHWQVRRQMQAATDGARRWDRAYMLILEMTLPAVPPASPEAVDTSPPAQKGNHEDGDLRAGFDLTASPSPDH